MSSYGELIQALGALKNVKEKRHGIKTLSSFCANRAFQVRIVQRGGWRNAILPLIISLDDECRKYAALAIANLSTNRTAHDQLLNEDVLRQLVPILYSEEVQEVIIYVLNALGNFACSQIMWQQMSFMNTVEAVVGILKNTAREEIKVNALFFLANLSADPAMREQARQMSLHILVWEHMTHTNFMVMQYALAVLRGLSVEAWAQKVLTDLGIVPLLIGIFQSQSPNILKTMVLDIFLHLSFLHSNGAILLEPSVSECVEEAIRSVINPEFVPTGIAIVANLCENVELHDRITESPLFMALSELVHSDNANVQQHVIRALMQLSLSPKYHHVILATGVMANACLIAMTDRLPVEMRINMLEMMGSICATHPTTPTESDIVDLLFLVCSEESHVEIRRASMMVLANASADSANAHNILRRPYVEASILALSKATDVVLVDYMMQFFHNICKMDVKTGTMLMQSGYDRHMFTYERLESLSITSAIYLCDTCRQLAEDTVVRGQILQQMMFQTMLDAWAVYIEEPHIAPHLALMCSAFAYHADTHQEYVMQGGVRLVIELYSRSEVEHVRLCCILTLLYLADSSFSQRSIAQERGIQMLLSACENETHVDLVTNAMKSLIPFASSDDYRSQLGMEGGIDTFGSFLFSDKLNVQQLGGYLLQNLLEVPANRRIFLGLSEEKQTEEDYLDPLVRFLPTVKKGGGGRIAGMKSKSGKKSPTKKGESTRKKEEMLLTDHDPFVVRCCIHSLALLCLEHDEEVRTKFIDSNVPQLLFTIFYSEQVDKSSGEAILLFFANLMHATKHTQAAMLRSLEVLPMLLSSHDLGFSPHTNIRCLSALLSISRTLEFRSRVLMQLDLIMLSVNTNLSGASRDESFYCTAALHCALLCELAHSPSERHEQIVKAGVVEAFLVFITIAGRGLQDELCIELLMSAVFGVSTLVSSPTCGEVFMRSLLFPATRLQLFVSLLRLPVEDINTTFYLGTYGLRTLQRTVAPGLRPEELQVDMLKEMELIDLCGVRPGDFIYRHVVRTLCLLLAHPELGRSVQAAISVQNVVPTCLFALRGTSDIFVEVFGYILVACFSTNADTSLQSAFVSDSSVINDLLSCCRRFGPGAASSASSEQKVALQLAQMGKNSVQWNAKTVNLNRYLLAMVALSSLAERIRETYRHGSKERPGLIMGTGGTDDKDLAGQLTSSNHLYMTDLPGICLDELDCEDLLAAPRMTQVQEFTALLRVIVTHNSLLKRIELNGVKVVTNPMKSAEEHSEVITTGHKSVLPELRSRFNSLNILQVKCDGLLRVVEHCLELDTAAPLVTATIECLCSLLYLSPLTISDPKTAYKLIKTAPNWVQPSLCRIFCNSLSDASRVNDEELMSESESDHLFPLITTSPQETRRYVVGALANVGTRLDLFSFLIESGVFRVYKPVASRAHFAEQFAVTIEMTRLLGNVTVYPDTHKTVNVEDVISFIADVLRHSSALLIGNFRGSQKEPRQEKYEWINVTFSEDDAPPLGLRILWEKPPKITEILPNTPATRFAEDIVEGDELMEVNGVDISGMNVEQIAPLFESRPLRLAFRRCVELDQTRLPREDEHDQEPEIQAIDGTIVEYGDPDRYLECFNLAVLALHNIAVRPENHHTLLAEPKILDLLLRLIPMDVLSPSFRRVVFSFLTSMCQHKDLAGRIFQTMADYFMSCEKADPSLQKYVVLAANLYYTSVDPDKTQPDRGMLVFVGSLASLDGMSGANGALVEILHRMSLGPKEMRGQFVSRETLVLTTNFIDLTDFEVQIRAFEVAYFLTIGAFQPALWASVDLIPRMVRAAAAYRRHYGDHWDELHQIQEDALWEITMRTAMLCLVNEHVLRQMSLPELDRYLMDLLIGSAKPGYLVKCAGHLMSGLLQSDIAGGCWTRWKNMGVAEKFIQWFRQHQDGTSPDSRPTYRGVDGEVIAEGIEGADMDAMLHMLLFAVEIDPPFVATLGADSAVSCIAARLLKQVAYYKRLHQAGGDAAAHGVGTGDSVVEEVHTNSSFRGIGQLVTSLAANEHGLAAMSRMGLPLPLVSLLELPAESYREPTLVMLSALSRHKETCLTLIRNANFKGILQQLEQQLRETGSSLGAQELEYFACIMDRSACHVELARFMQAEMLGLLCQLVLKSETMDAQLMVVRTLCNCVLAQPECVGSLSDKNLACLHYLMGATSCLRTAPPEEADSMAAVSRRTMLAGIVGRASSHPCEAQLAAHFGRIILCEAVSVSRPVCQVAFKDFDCYGFLSDVTASFNSACARIDDGVARMDIVTAELLNALVTMLHIVLCVTFRGSSEFMEPKVASRLVDSLVRVLDAVHGWLRLDELGKAQQYTHNAVAARLAEDIRVLFFLTALLREICAKPLHSIFIGVVRSRRFSEVLCGATQMALKRFERQMQGIPVVDAFATGKAASKSPLSNHMHDIDLAMVFEHLLVCMRHFLVQSMFVTTSAADVASEEPWCWAVQEHMQLHIDAVSWLPQVLKRFGETPGITTEIMRYICAAATFYVAPTASPQDDDTAAYALIQTFSLMKPPVLGMFVEVLMSSEDPCTLCLACLAVSNLTEYERQRVARVPPGSGSKVSDLFSLVAPLVRTLELVPTLPREIGTTSAFHILRTIIVLFSFEDEVLSFDLINCDLLGSVSSIFDFFFRDSFKIFSVDDYVKLLQCILQIFRNYIAVGCLISTQLEQIIASRGGSKALEAKVGTLNEKLNTPKLVNELTRVIAKFVDTPREIPDKAVILDGVFEEVIVCLQAIFARHETHGKLDWEEFRLHDFETLLEGMHAHRAERIGKSDDDELINILYIITKLGIQYPRAYFPDYLMRVAYGQREEHANIQDIAAVCCAIISTQASKGKKNSAPTCKIESVVSDCAKFIHSLAGVPNPIMRLWHYRTITMWSKRPKVLDEVTADIKALRYVVSMLSDALMGRYSVAFIHNISVLRSRSLLAAAGCLELMCQAYRDLGDGEGMQADADAQRRLLRHLLLSSIRNCLLHQTSLDTELDDRDLAAVIHLADCVEVADLPLYLAVLIYICKKSSSARVATTIPYHAPLVDLLIKCVLNRSSLLSAEGGGIEQKLYFLQEAGLPQSPRAAEEEEDVPEDAVQPAPTNATIRRAEPASPTRGLGRRTSLYQQKRRPVQEDPRGNVAAQGATQSRRSMAEERRYSERVLEYIYFAAAEVLTCSTFRDPAAKSAGAVAPVAAGGAEAKPDDVVRDAITAAFKNHSITAWLNFLATEAELHDSGRVVLTGLFVQVSMKFLYHCWSSNFFQSHFDVPVNIKPLIELAPFYLRWPDVDVCYLASELCLYARLHLHPAVCEFLGQEHVAYPELSCALLTHALVEEMSPISLRQAIDFFHVFAELLRTRKLTRPSLMRLAVSFETALLIDHPVGVCARVIQQEHQLLGDILEHMAHYVEAGTVKQCMVVSLALAAGRYYKAVPELDTFVLRVLDLAHSLLEGQFELFMPVLHRMAAVGGRRVQGPILAKHLHMRLARLLEEEVESLEASIKATKRTGAVAAETEPGPRRGLDARGRVQWIMKLFTTLASNEALASGSTVGKPGKPDPRLDLHFDAFVCVDLLPTLVKILGTRPQRFEAMCVGFLLSCVAGSPCIIPHMHSILKFAGSAFPELVESKHTTPGGTASGIASPEAQGWQHLRLPPSERMTLAMRRNFINILAKAGHLPPNNPALLGCPEVLDFVRSLERDPEVFEDPTAPVHCKLFCIANMCAQPECQTGLHEQSTIDILRSSEVQLVGDALESPRDLRFLWIHAVASLATLSGKVMLESVGGTGLVSSALRNAEEVLRNCLMKHSLLCAALECQGALSCAVVTLSMRLDFEDLRRDYALFLMGLICSAPLLNLRLLACEHLIAALSKGYRAEVISAVLLTTPCIESFERIICGPLDELAAGCARVMIAYVQNGGYEIHVRLLRNLPAVATMLGDTSVKPLRILWLAELFVVLTKERTAEIMDAALDLPDMMAFLALAKSHQSRLRELVQQWLEAVGSSLYEVDEVIAAFKASTMQGFLFVASRCTLEPHEAHQFRRVIFGCIYKRVETWRASVFGAVEFLTEPLIKLMIPMCELQPDLVAAVVALFHSFITQDEKPLLHRIWSGGHFVWLVKRLLHKSRAQLSQMQASKVPTMGVGKAWDAHGDLVACQGMTLRLLSELHDEFPMEVCTQAVRSGCVVKHWQEYITYYCHYPWPSQEGGSKEVEDATDAAIILAMQFVEHVTMGSDRAMQEHLIQQGLLSLALTMLLPSPADQRSFRDAIGSVGDQAQAPAETSDALPLPEAKMIAGAITSRIMHTPDTYRCVQQPRFAHQSVAMFAQVHNWRILIFEQQGSMSVVSTVPLFERCSTLYLALLSVTTLDWLIEQLGLGHMAVLAHLFLQIWSTHANIVMQHHSLRLFCSFCQVHVLYASVLAHTPNAEVLRQAVHRMWGKWDVRELRHVLRLLVAALAFALGLPVLHDHLATSVRLALAKPDAFSLSEILRQGGILRANQAAAEHLLLTGFLKQMLERCEQPGDNYGRVWCLWIVLAVLAHEDQSGNGKDGESKDPVLGPEAIIVFQAKVDTSHLDRRARMLAEQHAVMPQKDDMLGKSITFGKEDEPPKCRVEWVRGSPQLSVSLARMTGKAIAYAWRESQHLGVISAARFLLELPLFLETAVHTVEGNAVVNCLNEPEKTLNLCSLVLIGIISSFRVPLRAKTIAAEFLKRFHDLQETVIQGLATAGHGPYDLMTRWLEAPPTGLPCEADVRCLVAFSIGQCLCPPLATVPSLNIDEAAGPSSKGAGRTNAASDDEPGEFPAVTQCGPPPEAMLDRLSQEVLGEDLRLRNAQAKRPEGGPIFSTTLCHLLYALAAMVPLYPKAAAFSPSVRGAAFSQLIKVQNIVAQSIRAPTLFDPADEARAKLYLYIRATASIRAALQVIMGSWFAADFGARFAITEEGGRDFVQYCTKHIIQVYNNKTALTRVLGTPWERVMLMQGPTSTIAELLMVLCSSDANLLEVGRLGGQQALHSLSRYGETVQTRQQATMLLTKLAVISAPG